MKRFLKWFAIGVAAFIVLIIILAVTTGGDRKQGGSAQQSASREKLLPTPTPTPTFVELKDKALSVEYKELFRNIENYTGKLVYFKGKVVQVKEDTKVSIGKYYLLRINVTEGAYGFSDDDVRVNYQGSRVLEKDAVESVGSVVGLWKYRTVLGAERTIPGLSAVQLRLLP